MTTLDPAAILAGNSDAVPRYTSYPAAPHFQNALGTAVLGEMLDSLDDGNRLQGFDETGDLVAALRAAGAAFAMSKPTASSLTRKPGRLRGLSLRNSTHGSIKAISAIRGLSEAGNPGQSCDASLVARNPAMLGTMTVRVFSI